MAASAVTTMNGVRVIPHKAGTDWPEAYLISTFADHRPAEALRRTLGSIAERYGKRTTNVVAMQLEYREHKGK
jgi:hypothetical protein